MKRWIFGSIVFFLTLGIGVWSAWLFLFEQRVVEPVRIQSERREIVAPQPVGEDDFVPEFRGLPDFEEEESNQHKSKLIDVREIGNNYRSDEVVAKTGETWLGLFWNKEQLEFRRTLVRVTKETRPNYEDSVTLKFPAKNDPILLVRNASDLKEGKILTLESSIDSISESPEKINSKLTQGFRKNYTLSGQSYLLRVTTGIQRDGGKVNVLLLESNGKTQILTFNFFYKDSNTLYDSIGELLWVGDMDGDGRLDLYFADFGFEKGGFGSNLFLSSAATEHELVRQVASFGTSGC